MQEKLNNSANNPQGDHSFDQTRRKSIITVPLVSLFFISLTLSAWIFVQYFLPKEVDNRSELIQPPTADDKAQETPKVDLTPDEPVNTKKIYEMPTPTPEDLFFELQPTIGNQVTYIAHPIEVDTDNPPNIVIYSHGQITHVSRNFEDPFMLQLRELARIYTANNFIFTASEQHGANFGNDESVNDTKLLGDWIEENYDTSDKYHLIGFSMGGLPSLNFARKYPSKVASISLHAPATYYHLWSDEDFMNLKQIPIHVWHGQDDVNIDPVYSQQFHDDGTDKGLQIGLDLVKDMAHFGIEEYAKEPTIEFIISHQD